MGSGGFNFVVPGKGRLCYWYYVLTGIQSSRRFFFEDMGGGMGKKDICVIQEYEESDILVDFIIVEVKPL